MERSRAARVLGVEATATPEQIRDAYRSRARGVHPDATGGDTAAMVELNAAYATLRARVGDGWEFVVAPNTGDPWTDDHLDAWTDDHLDGTPAGRLSLLRFVVIALLVLGVVMTTVVFVAAIGYDWSVSR